MMAFLNKHWIKASCDEYLDKILLKFGNSKAEDYIDPVEQFIFMEPLEKQKLRAQISKVLSCPSPRNPRADYIVEISDTNTSILAHIPVYATETFPEERKKYDGMIGALICIKSFSFKFSNSRLLFILEDFGYSGPGGIGIYGVPTSFSSSNLSATKLLAVQNWITSYRFDYGTNMKKLAQKQGEGDNNQQGALVTEQEETPSLASQDQDQDQDQYQEVENYELLETQVPCTIENTSSFSEEGRDIQGDKVKSTFQVEEIPFFHSGWGNMLPLTATFKSTMIPADQLIILAGMSFDSNISTEEIEEPKLSDPENPEVENDGEIMDDQRSQYSVELNGELSNVLRDDDLCMFEGTQENEPDFELIVTAGDHQSATAAILKDSISLEYAGMDQEEMEDMKDFMGNAMDDFVDAFFQGDIKESGEAEAEEIALDGFVNDSDEEGGDDDDEMLDSILSQCSGMLHSAQFGGNSHLLMGDDDNISFDQESMITDDEDLEVNCQATVNAPNNQSNTETHGVATVQVVISVVGESKEPVSELDESKEKETPILATQMESHNLETINDEPPVPIDNNEIEETEIPALATQYCCQPVYDDSEPSIVKEKETPILATQMESHDPEMMNDEHPVPIDNNEIEETEIPVLATQYCCQPVYDSSEPSIVHPSEPSIVHPSAVVDPDSYLGEVTTLNLLGVNPDWNAQITGTANSESHVGSESITSSSRRFLQEEDESTESVSSIDMDLDIPSDDHENDDSIIDDEEELDSVFAEKIEDDEELDSFFAEKIEDVEELDSFFTEKYDDDDDSKPDDGNFLFDQQDKGDQEEPSAEEEGWETMDDDELDEGEKDNDKEERKCNDSVDESFDVSPRFDDGRETPSFGLFSLEARDKFQASSTSLVSSPVIGEYITLQKFRSSDIVIPQNDVPFQLHVEAPPVVAKEPVRDPIKINFRMKVIIPRHVIFRVQPPVIAENPEVSVSVNTKKDEKENLDLVSDTPRTVRRNVFNNFILSRRSGSGFAVYPPASKSLSHRLSMSAVVGKTPGKRLLLNESDDANLKRRKTTSFRELNLN